MVQYVPRNFIGMNACVNFFVTGIYIETSEVFSCAAIIIFLNLDCRIMYHPKTGLSIARLTNRAYGATLFPTLAQLERCAQEASAPSTLRSVWSLEQND